MQITLERPAEAHRTRAYAYRQAHFDAGEQIINGSELLDRTADYGEWLTQVTRNADPAQVSPDWVLTDTFFAVDGAGEIVGIIDLRHTLNDFLRDFGHCGFSVRPDMRRQGCASEMLRQVLKIAAAAGMETVQLSAEADNLPSLCVIRKNGGVYTRSFLHEGRRADVYTVDLTKEQENHMKTIMLSADDPADIARAAALIRAGEAVGMPTETVYGLGCDAGNPDAVRKVFAAKGRPADNPLIVHIADIDAWQPLVTEIPPLARALAERFWPGPLTMILPRTDRIPAVTAGGLDTVGVRFPAHPAAQALIRAAGVPIAAPSGNRSGSPSPTASAHMLRDMDGRIPAIIEGGACLCGVESTVISFDDSESVRILRPGFVTPEQLQGIAKHVTVDPAVLAQLDPNLPARSPGMKYKHYAPNAAVTLVQGDRAQFLSLMREKQADGVYALVFDADLPDCEAAGIRAVPYGDTDEQRAAAFFARLRELDDQGAAQIFVRAPRTDGVGLAVYNRLIRAAGYHVVHAG